MIPLKAYLKFHLLPFSDSVLPNGLTDTTFVLEINRLCLTICTFAAKLLSNLTLSEMHFAANKKNLVTLAGRV